MATLTEAAHAAEFILSEANGARSRDAGTLDTGDLAAGTVVEWSGSKLIAYTGGSGGVAGILIYAADATDADVAVAYLARDAEVNGNLLTSGASDDATDADLATLGIIVRR